MPTAVITGGSSGLGAACVEAFQEAGYRVASIDLLAQKSRDGVLELSADVTDAGSVARAFDKVAATFGPARALVHAAGIYPRSTLDGATADQYRRIFDVNVLGTVLVDQAFARTARRGSVAINIASIDGIEPFGLSILYSASKAAVISLTAGIADEMAEQGIRVLALAPGYIATDTVKEIKRSRGEEMPLDASEPIEIGRTCVRLCADGGVGLITGQTLVVRTSALERD